MNFSVLISVYGEKPEYLALALKSIWDDQTLKPTEIVIVKDGPLSSELDKIISFFSESAPVKIHALEKNQGLGIALAEGVKKCQYNYIARMDSDDIAFPERFEKQFSFLKEHPEIDICGSAIAEFSFSLHEITGYRKPPEKEQDIMRFLKIRNPINHMTVVFKKQTIVEAGNYQPLLGYEDYWLWARCMANGAKCYNLQEPLVYARIGNGMLERRRGLKLVSSEILLEKKLYRIGLLSFFEMIMIISIKCTLRLLPVKLLKMIYKNILRRH